MEGAQCTSRKAFKYSCFCRESQLSWKFLWIYWPHWERECREETRNETPEGWQESRRCVCDPVCRSSQCFTAWESSSICLGIQIPQFQHRLAHFRASHLRGRGPEGRGQGRYTGSPPILAAAGMGPQCLVFLLQSSYLSTATVAVGQVWRLVYNWRCRTTLSFLFSTELTSTCHQPLERAENAFRTPKTTAKGLQLTLTDPH